MNGIYLASPVREELVMLIGPSWAPEFIALLRTKFGGPESGPIRERRSLP